MWLETKNFKNLDFQFTSKRWHHNATAGSHRDSEGTDDSFLKRATLVGDIFRSAWLPVSHANPSCLVLETLLRLSPTFLEFGSGQSVVLTAPWCNLLGWVLRGPGSVPQWSQRGPQCLHCAVCRNRQLSWCFWKWNWSGKLARNSFLNTMPVY